MRYEVEQKFPVADLELVRARLEGMGTRLSEPREEVDVYYRHPARDFSQTDEALRLRRVGADNSLTYKGPKIDAVTKTRREIELPLGPGEASAAAGAAMLEALGFTPVAEVRKRRRRGFVQWEGRRIQATLDEVVEVGTFVELELVAEAEDVPAARAAIASLAAELGFSRSQRKSYLELLLQRRAGC
ncbi:MAG TPA: class IV adenylate cyclase [Planctomycetaceae bacterium]|nr:class IV adenylate cyclase [Planctomycetaceae bacterium]